MLRKALVRQFAAACPFVASVAAFVGFARLLNQHNRLCFGPQRSRALYVKPKTYVSFAAFLSFLGPIFLLFLVILSALPAKANPEAIELHNENKIIEVKNFAEVFVDSSNELRIDGVRTPEIDAQFKKAEKNLEFGYHDAAHWIRFAVENKSGEANTYFFDSSYPLIDSLRYHSIDESGRIETQELGDALPFYARPIITPSLTHSLHLPPHSQREIYVRAKTTSSLSVPIKIYSEISFIEFLYKKMLIIGIFYGIVLGLIAYNSFLYVMTQEKDYLNYVFFALFNTLFSASMDGVGYQLLPNLIYWESISTYVYLCFAGFFAMRFARGYLATKSEEPRMDGYLRISEWTFFSTGVLLVFFPSTALFKTTLLVMVLAVGCLVTVAAVRMFRGYRPARLLLLAWATMLSSICFGVLTSIGLLPFQPILPYIHKIGLGLEMILLSIALANRINELKSSEQAAQSKASQANAEAKAKTEFLAKMSHEIRTPMNGVLGLTELLSHSELDARQQGMVDSIHASGNILLHIINDILDLSKLNAGKMKIESCGFDLEALVDDCRTLFYVSAQKKALPFLTYIDPALSRWFKGDPTRIRQVLVNLLGNAYKFTARGSVTLKVLKHEDERRRSWVRFEVCDTGVGISPAAQTKLFEAFAQEDSSTTRKYGGTGLGLAISKQFVELMGGRIGVESNKGQGSTFWFNLRLLPYTPAKDQSERFAQQKDRLRAKNIILLAPENDEYDYLKGDIKSWGAQVFASDCPNDLRTIANLPVIKHFTPDVLLLDHHENTPGPEIAATIADLRQALGSELPLVVRASCQAPPELQAIEKLWTIDKSAGRSQLRALLCVALGTSEFAISKTRDGVIHPDDPSVDRSLRVLVAEDNPVNRRVIEGMLNRLGIQHLDIVENGLLALRACENAPVPYDIIFMDCEMPVMNGYDATAKIRALPTQSEYRSTIYALSAHAMQEHRDKALNAQMDGHLAKPITMDRLRAVLYSKQPVRDCA